MSENFRTIPATELFKLDSNISDASIDAEGLQTTQILFKLFAVSLVIVCLFVLAYHLKKQSTLHVSVE
jgi:hypothetical protein